MRHVGDDAEHPRLSPPRSMRSGSGTVTLHVTCPVGERSETTTVVPVGLASR